MVNLEITDCKIDILFLEVDSIKKLVNENINVNVRDESEGNGGNSGGSDSCMVVMMVVKEMLEMMKKIIITRMCQMDNSVGENIIGKFRGKTVDRHTLLHNNASI